MNKNTYLLIDFLVVLVTAIVLAFALLAHCAFPQD